MTIIEMGPNPANEIERRGNEMVHSRKRKANRVRGLVLLLGAACALGASPASAEVVEGENFSFAPVSAASTTAPAFPSGLNARAFWAGVCDLTQNAAAVGTPSAARAHCIEHPTYFGEGLGLFSGSRVPPMAPGVADTFLPGQAPSGADGWHTGDSNGTLLAPGGAPSWRLADATQAGARPDGTTSFWFSRSSRRATGAAAVTGTKVSDGALRTVSVKLPPGVVGNPRALPKCPAEAIRTVPTSCPSKTQVGVSTIALAGVASIHPVYNVEPRDGYTAEFVISGAGKASGLNANVFVTATARTDQDFGVEAMSVEIPAGLPVVGQSFTFWGVPWAKSHDKYRPIPSYCGSGNELLGMLESGLPGGTGGSNGTCSQTPQSYDPSWGPIRPFLTTQTECAAQNPVTSATAANWHTDTTDSENSVAPLLTGCGDIQFPLTFDLDPTSSSADAATGLDVDLSIPQNNDPPLAKQSNANDSDPNSAVAHWKSTAGLARAHLKDSVVTLPQGFSVNPSAATGLAGCSDADVGVRDTTTNPLLFNNGDPFNKDGGADGAECPDGSIIGTAEVSTPLLEADEKLTGEVVLGMPETTLPTGETVSGKPKRMLRMFIVVRNRERDLIAKIYGSATADGVRGQGGTGKLVATFEKNPQVPFDNLKLRLKGGSHGLLATPQRCGSNTWSSVFTPWSGGTPVEQGGDFGVGSNCGYGFSPALQSGMSTPGARENGTFSFRFSRTDGQQWFKNLTAQLPKGLLASVRGLIGPTLCSSAQAAFEQARTAANINDPGGCPAASKIGTADAKAGSGDPFVLEQKGEVFLTQGYKGGEYGLLVKVRPIAGPFRGATELDPIVVRQAIHVDRTTAQVTAISDDFPTVWHGVPLRVREVTVNVDRGGFMLNPSNCGSKQVASTIASVEGQSSALSNQFGVTGCKALSFKPKLTLELTGRKQTRTGKHPGVRAVVKQAGVSEAGIQRAEVRLPKSLALDPANAQALCEFEDGTSLNPDSRCPKGSIVGRARAVSPLLNEPLVGNVYFVKNVRRDPVTGNAIRTLPMLIVALRGEIAVNLKGESSTTNSGKLVNTFASVPDAPISQFNLNVNGGSNGILAVTRTRRGRINLCNGKHIAEADMDGQNGKRHDFDVKMKTPCPSKKAKKKAASKKRG